jgi:proteasome lid subunit RPN8/RPN11
MNDVLAKALIAEAHNATPNECCGFVMAGWTYIPIQNCHPDPQQHFEMERESMLALLQHNAHEVLGIYHSHPRGSKEPSGYDVTMMQNYAVHGFRFWIVTYNNVYEWSISDDVARPVRRDGTLGSDLAYPVLTAPETLRREGERATCRCITGHHH